MDIGSFVNYRCSAGNLIGNSKLICSNGKWDGQLPFCEGKYLNFYLKNLICFNLVKFCSTPPLAPKNTFISYKRIFYANIEDFGKDHLAFDESVYKFKCKFSYKFENPLVNELTSKCIKGEWKLYGLNSTCILTNDGMESKQAFI